MPRAIVANGSTAVPSPNTSEPVAETKIPSPGAAVGSHPVGADFSAKSLDAIVAFDVASATRHDHSETDAGSRHVRAEPPHIWL